MSKRQVFFSFSYKNDNWRASQVRNMGKVEQNSTFSDNEWEEVKEKSDDKIKEWIDNQMIGRTCTIVLAGSQTANRKWINYEIEKSWENGMGVVVIYIHNLKDKDEKQNSKGSNPLYYVSINDNRLSTIAEAYDPIGKTSKEVYADIEANIDSLIEEAINIRKNYK